ncbi:hypothetical protein V2J09_011805 [Rumex salicifolius]
MQSAGTDTSARTMEWTISLLINHQPIFHKGRADIDTHVGSTRHPSLPYLRCIVNETLRLFAESHSQSAFVWPDLDPGRPPKVQPDKPNSQSPPATNLARGGEEKCSYRSMIFKSKLIKPNGN